MPERTPFTICEGRSGSGKSYYFGVQQLVEQFLPFETGRLITNVDLNPAAIEAYCRKHGGKWANNIKERLIVVTREEFKPWQTDIEEGGSGPWEYFAGKDIEGCHLLIDEFHTFCAMSNTTAHRRKWSEFLAEIRHRGGTVQIMTQTRSKLAKETVKEAGTLYMVWPVHHAIDRWTGCRIGDLLQFKAKFLTGKYLGGCVVTEYLPGERKWEKVNESENIYFTEEYFKLYDSQSMTQDGQAGAKRPPKKEWEVLSTRKFLLWFFSRNFKPLAYRFSVVAVCLLATIGGGAAYAMRGYLKFAAGPNSKVFNEAASNEKRPNAIKPGLTAAALPVVESPVRGLPNDLPQPREVSNLDGTSFPVHVEDWSIVVGITSQGVVLKGGYHVEVGERLLPGDDGQLDRVDPILGRYWLLADAGTPGRRPGAPVAAASIAERLRAAAEKPRSLIPTEAVPILVGPGNAGGGINGVGPAGNPGSGGAVIPRPDVNRYRPRIKRNGDDAKPGQGGGDIGDAQRNGLGDRPASAGRFGRNGAEDLPANP